MRQPINRIYYGPPGTGKTYELSKLLKREYEQAMTAVSNEEWRKQLIATRIANLTWWEAAASALHDLGGRAKVAQLHAHPFIQAVAAIKGATRIFPNPLGHPATPHCRRFPDRQHQTAPRAGGVQQIRGRGLAFRR
jgi:hypothetical protein